MTYSAGRLCFLMGPDGLPQPVMKQASVFSGEILLGLCSSPGGDFLLSFVESESSGHHMGSLGPLSGDKIAICCGECHKTLRNIKNKAAALWKLERESEGT